MANKRKRLPTYSSEQGRVNSTPSIDEKIAKARRELGLTDKPKSFADKCNNAWDKIVSDTKLMFNQSIQTA